MNDDLRRSISSGDGSSENMPQGMAEASDPTTAEVADASDQQSDLALDIQALQILDSSDDCIKVLDLDGRILFMSRGGQELLDIQDVKPFLHTSWIEFWQGADRQAAREAIAKARIGEVATFQGYCPTPSGKPKWWDVKINLIRGTEGQVERLLCISRDITERRQFEEERKQAEAILKNTLEELQVTEEELRQQNEELAVARELAEQERYRYQNLFDFAPNGYVVTDAHGVIQEANRAFSTLTAIEPYYLVNTPLAVYISESDRRAFRNLLYELCQQPEVQKLRTDELSLHRSGKNPVPISITGTVILNSQAQIVGVRWLIQDITERKQAEAALRESEAQFRLFTTASSDTVYKMSADWREMRLLEGKNFLTSTSHPNETWLEQYIPAGEQSRVMAAIAEAIRTKSIFELEHQVIQVDGTIGWTFSRAIPLLDPQGEIIEWLGAASDVTTRKRAELSADFLATVTQNLAGGASVEDIVQTVGEQLHRYLQVSICAFVEIDERAEVAVIDHSWHLEDVPSLAGRYHLPQFVTGEFFQTARLGQAIIVRDVTTDSRIADAERFATLKIGSFINVPLIRNGEWKFTLGVYHQTPYNWRDDEIHLMGELATRIWTKLERTRVEIALRASEAKYRGLFESLDEGYFLADVIFDENDQPIDIFYLEANPAATRMVGQDFTGRRLREIDPNYEAYWYEIFGRVAQTGIGERLERYAEPDQTWYDFYVFKVGDEHSRRVSVVFKDVTERKRREAHAAFLAEISEDFSRLSTADEIMQTVGAKIGAYLQITTCNFTDVDEDCDRVTVHHGWSSPEVPSTVGTFRTSQYLSKEFERASRAGETVIICNTQNDPRTNAAGYAALNMYSFVTVPFHRNGRWTHYIAICHSQPRDWRKDEIQLIEEISNRIFPRLQRARIEEALRISESKYRSLFTSIDEGFNLLEMIPDESGHPVDFRILETNPAWERQTGLTDATDRTLLEVAPDFEQQWLDFYSDVVISGRGRRTEYYTASVDRWYTVYASRIGGEGSRQVAVVFNDITDRKRTEEQLRDSAEQQQFLLNFSDALRLLPDEETIERTSLQLLAQYLRLDRVYIAAVYRSDDRAVIGPEYRRPDLMPMAGELHMSDFPEAFKIVEEQTLVVENIADHPTLSDQDRQSLAAINLTALVVASARRGERNVIWSVVVAMTTPRSWTAGEVALIETVAERTWAAVERARAEATTAADLRDTQLLRDLSARLATEENIQALYQEIMAAAIVLTQADAGTVQILDETTQDLVLLATQGIEQKMVERFHRVNASSNTPCGIALRSGVRSFVDFDIPASEDPDGAMRLHVEGGLLSAQSTPLLSRSGQPIGMVSTHWRTRHRPSDRELRFLDLLARQAADLIEQRRAEAQRKQLLEREQAAREEAEQANRIKDEFLAVLSHELRSPLNPILGWSKLLQNGKLDEAKTAQALATIERNAKLQSELIEDLLDVSRILRGKLSLNVAPVNLASVVRGAMETVRLASEAKAIQIEADLAEDVGLVSGDSTRLQQVVWNLLSNAVKFTPSGGQVAIRLERLDSSAQITISDTGQGIAPDFLPYVFDYFRQADAATTRKFGGLGLGLAIVRHLVELHGGTVRADSLGEGQGATFTIQLPLMQTPLPVNQDERSPQQSLNLNDIKILIVDDEPDTRDLVAFVLEQQGAQVVAATSASEALLVLSQAKPDVLLSDIGMPEMDGYVLIQQVRALAPEQGGQIPAIALTAYAGDTNHRQVIAAGFQKHISKPIEPEQLLQAIVHLIYPN